MESRFPRLASGHMEGFGLKMTGCTKRDPIVQSVAAIWHFVSVSDVVDIKLSASFANAALVLVSFKTDSSKLFADLLFVH